MGFCETFFCATTKTLKVSTQSHQIEHAPIFIESWSMKSTAIHSGTLGFPKCSAIFLFFVNYYSSLKGEIDNVAQKQKSSSKNICIYTCNTFLTFCQVAFGYITVPHFFFTTGFYVGVLILDLAYRRAFETSHDTQRCPPNNIRPEAFC